MTVYALTKTLNPITFLLLLFLHEHIFAQFDYSYDYPMLKSFHKDFLFGVATSAYQIEGDNQNDWTEWEKKAKISGRLTPCGKATDHWNRYENDFLLLKELGVNAYRFSLEWSRIEPKPGEINQTALQRYRDMVLLLKKLGIEPVVTLHHFTNPLWLHTDFPWHTEKSIERFAKYAEKVISTLSPEVKYWITINEPVVFILLGYIDGGNPPGFKDSKLAFYALKNLLLAHKKASEIIRHYSPEARIGIAHNMMKISPARIFNPLDLYLTKHADRFYNWMLVDAFAYNILNYRFFSVFRKREKLELKNTIDFLGINYYTRMHFKFDLLKPFHLSFFSFDKSKNGLSDMRWEIYPEGLESVLNRVYEKLHLPIIITENGIADREDQKRIKFITDHLKVLKRCQKNIPLDGYFYWSLLDNYEWLLGFEPRFGLYEVDYQTFERKKRKIADYFAKLAKGESEV
jgi:beta-glucosidase